MLNGTVVAVCLRHIPSADDGRMCLSGLSASEVWPGFGRQHERTGVAAIPYTNWSSTPRASRWARGQRRCDGSYRGVSRGESLPIGPEGNPTTVNPPRSITVLPARYVPRRSGGSSSSHYGHCPTQYGMAQLGGKRSLPPNENAADHRASSACAYGPANRRINTSSAGHGGPLRRVVTRSRAASCPSGNSSPASQRHAATIARTRPRHSPSSS